MPASQPQPALRRKLRAAARVPKQSSLAKGGGGGSARSAETEGVSDGAGGAIWSGGPNRGANAPAGAAREAGGSGHTLPRAFFVTDPVRTGDILSIVRRLPRGFGVIWRHFGAADRLETGRALARLCRRRGLVLLVSADPALAARIGAHGVHWPEARLKGVRLRPAGKLETAAAHSPRAIRRAHRLGVDAVIVSPVFPSRSPSAAKPLGALRFRQMARAAPLPVYALGGLTAANAARAMSHAAGWAAIDGVIEAWG